MLFTYRSSKSHKYGPRELLDLIGKLDDFFNPPFSKRVDLKDYTKKILKKAVIVSAHFENSNELAGMIAYYNNDTKTKMAYATFLGVLPKYQGRGVAKRLVDICVADCGEAGMSRIQLEAGESNVSAIRLFQSRGFEKKGIIVGRYKKGVNNILMEKKL